MPACVNAALIIGYGLIFKAVAFWLTDNENHRYTSKYENSLIGKIYMFEFINSYISNFIYAFWAKNFTLLATNLITILAFKQIGYNFLEYFEYRLLNAYFIRKVGNKYDTLISQEQDPAKVTQLKLHKKVEEELRMKKERSTLVFFYTEAIT